MNKLAYVLFILMFSLFTFCVTTSKNAWDPSKYYASNKVIEYRGGIWMSEEATIGDEPGVEGSNGNSPWILLSGENWEEDVRIISPHRYLLHCP